MPGDLGLSPFLLGWGGGGGLWWLLTFGIAGVSTGNCGARPELLLACPPLPCMAPLC